MSTGLIDGRCWLFGDDIDTDAMMPGDVLYASEERQTAALFRDARPGWVQDVRPGDVVVSGRNFGLGSSRPAARSLVNVGVALLIADSLNALFFRNCVSYGLIALACPGISAAVREGDRVAADPQTGMVLNRTTGVRLATDPVPPVLLATMRAGGTLPMLEAAGLISAPRAR